MTASESLKPLSTIDLMNNDSRLSDFNFDIKVPEEVNYQNLVHKLENKAKHLEIQIEQNRKRGRSICQECFNAMRATEVLAFDFLFTEYLIGTASSSQVYTFVDSCIRPPFNIISGDPRDIDAAADHIRTVQTQIQSSVSTILRSDPKKVEIAKRATEFLQFLRDKKQSLENELQNYEEETKNPKPQQNPTVIPVVFNDFNRSNKNDADYDFEKWILNELKPGVALVDTQTAEIRALFGTCIHRLHAIQELKDQIAQLKSTSSSTQNLKYIDCDPKTIYESPFFVAIKENCAFLGTALSAIHSHQQIIPECKDSIDRCEAYLKKLDKKCQNTLNQMKNLTDEKKANIEENKKKVESLTKKLKPYADALQFNEVSSLENLLTETDKLVSSLEKYLKDLLENLNNETSGDATENENKKSKIDGIIGVLQEVGEYQAKIKDLCIQSFASIRANIKTQNDLLESIFNYYKAVESVQLYQDEVQQLEEYEKSLKEIVKSMHDDDVKTWCRQLSDAYERLVANIQKQEDIYESFEPLVVIDKSGDEEIISKEQEVENLMEENKKLVEEEALLRVESVDAEEELFSLMQQIEALGGWSDTEIEERLSNCAICPICKEKQRNEILMSCGHPLCSECIAKAKSDHICPMCNAPFHDEDVKPFYLQ